MFNKLNTQGLRLNAVCVGVALACFSFAAQATTSSPVDGERLSDWLLRQPASASSYSTALQWQVPSERDAQSKLKRSVLAELNALSNVPASARTN